MASILVRAFDLDKIDTGDDVDVNMDDVSGVHQDAVQTLANLGITDQVPDFDGRADINRGQFASMLYDTMQVVKEYEKAPEIDGVSAINTKEAKVDFTKEVKSLDRDDVKVQADGGNKQFIKSVKLAENGESATVEFYDKLSADTTYNVNVTVGDETLEGEITVGDLEPATIEADAEQTVKANDEDQKVDFTAYDADGVDVTNEYSSDDFNFTSKAVDADGKVNLEPGTSTTTKVQYKNDDDKVVAESGDIALTAVEAKADDISNWTTGDDNFDSDDYEQKTNAFGGDNLSIEVKDQFDNVLDSDNYDVEYKSLDTDVAIVDRNDGEISVNKTGTVPVEISVKQDDDTVLTKTVEVSAKEDAELDEIKLDEENLSLSTKDTNGKTIKATLVNQYGDKFEDFDGNINIENDDDALDISESDVEDGVAEFNVSANDSDAEEGDYEVTVSAEDVEETLDVELVNPGLLKSYDVRGLEDTLDLNDENEDNTPHPNDVELTVVPVDADGYVAGSVVDDKDISYVIKDEKGDTVEDDSDNDAKFSDLNKEGNYTAEISTESTGLLEEHDFEVVNTEKDPEVTFTSSSLNDDLDEGEDQMNALTEALADITEIDGDKAEANDIDSVDFNTNAKNVIELDDDKVKTKDGEATIYINEIEVNETSVDVDNQPVDVKVSK